MIIKNIEKNIKFVTICYVVLFIGTVVICLGCLATQRGILADASRRVYVIDSNHVPILVTQTDQEETLDIEARSHVEMFHNLFYTLAPDQKYIERMKEKFVYLIDESGLAEYNTLHEKGFYHSIIRNSASQVVICDSIHFDKATMEFTYYGRQRIERRSMVEMRYLVTSGKLRRVERSENNPHGLLIFNWRVFNNDTFEKKEKSI